LPVETEVPKTEISLVEEYNDLSRPSGL